MSQEELDLIGPEKLSYELLCPACGKRKLGNAGFKPLPSKELPARLYEAHCSCAKSVYFIAISYNASSFEFDDRPGRFLAWRSDFKCRKCQVRITRPEAFVATNRISRIAWELLVTCPQTSCMEKWTIYAVVTRSCKEDHQKAEENSDDPMPTWFRRLHKAVQCPTDGMIPGLEVGYRKLVNRHFSLVKCGKGHLMLLVGLFKIDFQIVGDPAREAAQVLWSWISLQDGDPSFRIICAKCKESNFTSFSYEQASTTTSAKGACYLKHVCARCRQTVQLATFWYFKELPATSANDVLDVCEALSTLGDRGHSQKLLETLFPENELREIQDTIAKARKPLTLPGELLNYLQAHCDGNVMMKLMKLRSREGLKRK